MEDRLPVYKPREKNVIQEILHDHFKSFEKNYDAQYSEKYSKYRIMRIKEAVEKFIECGDYSKGIARIRCTNPGYGYDYFRTFAASLKIACKAWYLCPSCHQKRILHRINIQTLRWGLYQMLHYFIIDRIICSR